MIAPGNKLERIISRLVPGAYWAVYWRKAKRLGLTEPLLVLSFDCDTPEDAQASEKLFAWLEERGVPATFAVPGQTLKQGASTYRDIASAGAEFINHGGLPHAEYRDDRYWSITFYHEMGDDGVRRDIEEGHALVAEVTGKAPVGFRAPHFGLYNQPAQLTHKHRVLESLGYRYSTSTIPAIGLRNGPVYRSGSLWEIPMAGWSKAPISLLDSWSLIESPQYPRLTRVYRDRFCSTVDLVLKKRIPAVLNYYVDPAHVMETPYFCEAVDYALQCGVRPVNYRQLIHLIEQHAG